MIDQGQARKFWTNWVRREIGGSDMVQEAAVSAAVNELLLGHDNQAAADAARNTARQLGGGPSTSRPEPSRQGGRETVATPPAPMAPGGPAPAVASQLPAPLNPGKSVLRRPWLYVGGVVGIAATAVVVIFVVRSAHNIGCLVSQTTLGHRMTTLHNAFVDVYNRDFNVIDACTSVDCEKAPKLEIAASLKTYNDGLDKICWPNKYTADVTALKQANTGMGDAFSMWATATTPAEDQSLETAAKEQDARQGVADDALSRDLGVPVVTPAATPS
jgi:hypothetical protein